RFDDVSIPNHNELTTVVAHTGIQSSRLPAQAGPAHGENGKLIKFISPVEEIGLRGWVYFDPGVSVPNSTGNPINCRAGLHLWRLFRGSSPGGQIDGPVLDSSQVQARIDFFPGDAGGVETIYEPSPEYRPATPAFNGRWVLWELYVKLNTPGVSDGIVKWWIDNEATPRVDIANGNFRSVAGAAFKIDRVNFQSNVGGCDSAWPKEEWWAVDDLEIWVP
ncbi:hypothetical protein LCGC14_2701110, partial [marine sediment metagenome]